MRHAPICLLFALLTALVSTLVISCSRATCDAAESAEKAVCDAAGES